ncbi:MAG: hypothetical protein ACKVOG_07180 [Rhodoglobus sp.]
MRREIITWSAVAALVIGGFAGTVLLLNATLYSASGFVGSYLDALARQDAPGALELAGPSVAGDASTRLLERDAMGELGDIRLISDAAQPDGTHTVIYSFTAGEVIGQSSFTVRPTGTLLGLFTTWSFDTPPLGVVQLTVLHDDEFTANGVNLTTPRQNESVPYLVFTPGLYEFDHETTFLTAEAVRIAVTEPGSAVPAAVDVQANQAFADKVSREITTFLDGCATQQVLLPTGCPFGQTITNRVITSPAWSIVDYPKVTIIPGSEPSQWRMSQASATAHLIVDVKSLFDGTVSTLDENVPFSLRATIALLPEDELVITVE